MLKNTLRNSLYWIRLTKESYDSISRQFVKLPSVSVFGEYFHRDNLVQIFSLVKETSMKSMEKMHNFSKIQELCSQGNDMDFNILANIHRQKCLIFYSQKDLPSAIIQIEKAIETILLMDKPYQFQVVMLYETYANLLIQSESYSKAEKSLQEAKNTLQIFSEELHELLNEDKTEAEKESIQKTLKVLDFLQAKLYSNFGIVYMKTNQYLKAEQSFEKASQKWQEVPEKHKIHLYETTVKYKCILYSHLKQNSLGRLQAQQYLSQVEKTDENTIARLWFIKFLGQYDEKYQSQFKQNLENLKKILKPEVFEKVLRSIGVQVKGDKKPQN